MRTHFCAVAVLAGGLLEVPAVSEPPPPLARVRPTDPAARQLLTDSWQRSKTVRDLTGVLEVSDLIVYIRTQPAGASYRGYVRFAVANGVRYLRVAVPTCGLPGRLIPRLAHELQHAVEIARAPEVRDTKALETFWRRIGWRRRSGVFETDGALAIEARVRLELTRPLKRAP